MEEKNIKKAKKPIRQTLLKLNVYESSKFPIAQVTSVRSTVYLLRDQFGIEFTTKKIDKELKVTRIA